MELFDLQTSQQQGKKGLNQEYVNTFEDAKCIKGSKVEFVCQSEKCTARAGVCGDKACDCRKQHKRISCTWIDPELIVEAITEKKGSNKELIEKVNQKFDEIIDQISIYRDKIIVQMSELRLTTIEKQFLQILDKREFETLHGKTISLVLKGLDDDSQNFNEYDLNKFQLIERELDRVLGQNQKIFQSLLGELEKFSLCEIEASLKFQASIQIESKIVTNNMELGKLMKLFQGGMHPRAFKLLYRGSQSNFLIDAFWTKCEGFPKTLVLIKTTQGLIIGGYYEVKWKRELFSKWPKAGDEHSFLFSLTQNEKFLPYEIAERKTLENNMKQDGPRFGLGDLCIKNQSNVRNDSYASLGQSYGKGLFQYSTAQSRERFTGSKGGYFTTSEWEVFQIHF